MLAAARQPSALLSRVSARSLVRLRVGDAELPVRPPTRPDLVPGRPALPETPWVLSHVEWLMRKHLLGQDAFLLGPPGPLRRRVAMLFCSLARLETEYVSISRDTTESDLKQRREVVGGAVEHIDQAAVRAAREGRVLILDGVERAERNVLPILNNLLENREMNLDDGRFLVAPATYDKLLRDHTAEQLDAWRLLRVSENFRVIALGVPSPPFTGSPLDPPFRSRFQVRYIGAPDEETEMARHAADSVFKRELSVLRQTFTEMTNSTAALPGNATPLPRLPIDATERLSYAAPDRVSEAFRSVYPFPLDAAQQRAVNGILDRVGFKFSSAPSQSSGNPAQVSLGTVLHDETLAALLRAHPSRDLCIIGPRGSGKSMLADALAKSTGQTMIAVPCYKDLTSRDLLQRRATAAAPAGTAHGTTAAAAAAVARDTVWRDAPLVRAAVDGHMAVLDGVERLSSGTLASLQSLLSDRRLTLPDGTSLVPSWEYKEMVASGADARTLRPVHDKFRVVALATDEWNAGGDLNDVNTARSPAAAAPPMSYWLTDEAATLFDFVHVRAMARDEEEAVIRAMAPAASPESVSLLAGVTGALRAGAAGGSSNGGIAPSVLLGGAVLSTRQSIRIARKLAALGDTKGENLHALISEALLEPFMPSLARSTLDQLLARCGVTRPAARSKSSGKEDLSGIPRVDESGENVVAGNVRLPRYVPSPSAKALVPNVSFFDNARHAEVLRAMMLDFSLGEHLLLIGNQGVGKNKLCDRMLQLLNRPREYIQLHRDSTVQALLVQPRLEDGALVYDDAPLVRAVKNGHVLVVDEADKAPVHVTAVLKSLAEHGELALPDGRVIRPRPRDASKMVDDADIVYTHPDFRLIVLANRPGFPFLGNDFFSFIGDAFSAHPVGNPDIASEAALLANYAPSLPPRTLTRLASALADLRAAFDDSVLSYPYSLRELAAVVRHLERFPDASLRDAVRNVFDFDMHQREAEDILRAALQRQGLPLDALFRAEDRDLRSVRTNVSGALPSDAAPLVPAPVQLQRSERTPVSSGPAWKALDMPWRDRGWSDEFTSSPRVRNTVAFESARAGHVEKFDGVVGQWRVPTPVNSNVVAAATSSDGTGFAAVTRVPHRLYYYPLSGAGAPLKEFVVDMPSVSKNVDVFVAPALGPRTSLVIDRLNGMLIQVDASPEGECTATPLAARDGATALLDGSLLLTAEADNVTATRLSSGKRPMQITRIGGGSRVASVSNHSALVWGRTDGDAILLRFSTDGKTADTLTFPLSSPIAQFLESDVEAQAGPAPPGSPPDAIATLAAGSNVAIAFADGSIEQIPYSLPPADGTVNTVRVLDGGLVVRATDDSVSVVDVVNETQRVQTIPPPVPARNSRSVGAPINAITSATDKGTVALVRDQGHVVVMEASEEALRDGAFEYARLASADMYTPSATQVTLVSQTSRRPMVEYVDSEKKADDVMRENDSPPELSSPKHGEEDDLEHIGGSRFAGGSGGSNTAGLGGRGGPYRLAKKGQRVVQVSPAAKAAVSREAREIAREMAQAALKDRLAALNMSANAAEQYLSRVDRVERATKQLKHLLDASRAREKERVWQRNRSDGELDEGRLVDGLTGESAVYKLRTDDANDSGAQLKPKRFAVAFDISGSMYRFNFTDGRLDRSLDAATLLMEAFADADPRRFSLEMVGHSGESACVQLVGGGDPSTPGNGVPRTEKERLRVLHMMEAHAQYCVSGDATTDATRGAILRLARTEFDEAFVIVVSDANLERYGIEPREVQQALAADPRVNAHIIFVGSLGDQAEELAKALPPGKTFICNDAADLPNIIQQIFALAMRQR